MQGLLGASACLEVTDSLRIGRRVRMTDPLLMVDADLLTSHGAGEIVFLLASETRVPTGNRFPIAVADLWRYHQPLLVQIDGAARFALGHIGLAQFGQEDALIVAAPAAQVASTPAHRRRWKRRMRRMCRRRAKRSRMSASRLNHCNDSGGCGLCTIERKPVVCH